MSGKTVYIVLFRGVGGATQLPTAPLREELAKAGFENVATYINSGNAVVRSDKSREAVISEIAAICREKFSFDKAVHARTRAEWATVIANNPFSQALAGKHLHAALLESKPSADSVGALKAIAAAGGGDGFEVVGGVAYVHTPNGLSKSGIGVSFDKKIGVPNTARNWNTVLKLMDLADNAASD